jgi:HlyD family secretion protein
MKKKIVWTIVILAVVIIVVCGVFLLGRGGNQRKLMPGMTATVSIVTAEARNVLKIPNGALRYRPAGAALRPSKKPTDKAALTQTGARRIPFVWIQGPNKKLMPVLIKTGITDNVYTEIVSGDLKEGDVIVTG